MIFHLLNWWLNVNKYEIKWLNEKIFILLRDKKISKENTWDGILEGFMQRNQQNIVRNSGHKYKMDNKHHSTYTNTSDIYCHISEEMEYVGITEKHEKKSDGKRWKYCQI